MRLTLRTLLAWLDDTLPPAEVRQIGQQVAESQFAQELVERIHRVTRQRRLTVPSATGPEATDPALVASYLDNELSPEQVADFEKRCLTSDVHLAEVASVHQILSLIGQKAKVPPEARNRMYRLVRGREATGNDSSRPSPPDQVEPTAAPVPPWTPPEPPKRSKLERYGPIAAVVGLMLLLVWSAWSLVPGNRNGNESALMLSEAPKAGKNAPGVPAEKAAPIAVAKNAEVNAKPEEEATAKPNVPPPSGEMAETESAEPEPANKESAKTAEKKDAAKAAADLPAGAVATVGKFDGVLLRWSDANSGWERVQAGAALKAEDRLVGLPPFRNLIQFGKARVELVGDTEVRLKATKNQEAGRFEFVTGRVVLQSGGTGAVFGVGFGGKTIALTLPDTAPVGLERMTHRQPGDTEPKPSTLRIYANDGDLKVAAGQASETLADAGSIEFVPPDQLAEKSKSPPPPWVSETTLSAIDEETGKQFLQHFKSDAPPMSSIMAAIEDDQERVRQLAVFALGAAGSVTEVTAALGRPTDSAVRRAAIPVLRRFGARSAESNAQLRTALNEFGGPEWAPIVEKLLNGFAPKEEKEEGTYALLVSLLKHRDTAVRELALDNLLYLTKRDPLGYDPDKPEGPGLKAWQDLLKRGELAPSGKDDAR